MHFLFRLYLQHYGKKIHFFPIQVQENKENRRNIGAYFFPPCTFLNLDKLFVSRLGIFRDYIIVLPTKVKGISINGDCKLRITSTISVVYRSCCFIYRSHFNNSLCWKATTYLYPNRSRCISIVSTTS